MADRVILLPRITGAISEASSSSSSPTFASTGLISSTGAWSNTRDLSDPGNPSQDTSLSADNSARKSPNKVGIGLGVSGAVVIIAVGAYVLMYWWRLKRGKDRNGKTIHELPTVHNTHEKDGEMVVDLERSSIYELEGSNLTNIGKRASIALGFRKNPTSIQTASASTEGYLHTPPSIPSSHSPREQNKAAEEEVKLEALKENMNKQEQKQEDMKLKALKQNMGRVKEEKRRLEHLREISTKEEDDLKAQIAKLGLGGTG